VRITSKERHTCRGAVSASLCGVTTRPLTFQRDKSSSGSRAL
jgi:hypothetical protein